MYIIKYIVVVCKVSVELLKYGCYVGKYKCIEKSCKRKIKCVFLNVINKLFESR